MSVPPLSGLRRIPRREVALAGAVLHLLFSLIIQIENFVLYLLQPVDGWRSVAAFAAALPFHQIQHIALAALLAGLGWLLAGGIAGRLVYLALCASVWLYAIVDQAAFHILFRHIDRSLVDLAVADVRTLADSVRAELPPELPVNAALFLALLVVLVRTLFRPASGVRRPLWAGPRFARVAAALAILTNAAVAISGATNHTLEQAPLFALLASGVDEDVPVEKVVRDPTLYRLKFGEPGSRSDLDRAAADLRTSFRDGTRPNIVMVIMESVGSKQILPGGSLSATITPQLAGLQDRMLIFDALYDTFPASMRSHVPINTGGRTITWSSFTSDTASRFTGPAIARSMKRAGYRTAIVSAGEFRTEYINGFYGSLGYDYVYEPAMESKAFVDRHSVHSWGLDEDIARQRAMSWIDGSDGSRPFFLQLLTIATHHPYAGPAGYTGPFSQDTSENRYKNALSYSDHVLGAVVRDLRDRRLLENTFIVICGDHGQAFGTFHNGNFLHQGYIYEENVRNFLLVIGDGRVRRPVRWSRPAFIGDIMPTILALAGLPREDVPGQDLLDPRYEERVAYFHKTLVPASWGLRDGRWKFISRTTTTAGAELYDLDRDPDETTNLASRDPARLAIYQRAAMQWYLETNQEYLSRLDAPGPSLAAGLTAGALVAGGPRLTKLGTWQNGFVELSPIHPREDVVAWTQWVPMPLEKRLVYRWTSPSGRTSLESVRVRAGWRHHFVYLDMVEPMEIGTWKVSILDGEAELLTQTFEVSADATLRVPINPSLAEARAAWGRP